MFKSHLYGIEISLRVVPMVTPSSLNRTFMELKWLLLLMLMDGRTFKSHLYGIEIKNLNYIKVATIMFKSHLYGIEIVHEHSQTSQN